MYRCHAGFVNVYVNVYLATVAYFYVASGIPPCEILFSRISTIIAVLPMRRWNGEFPGTAVCMLAQSLTPSADRRGGKADNAQEVRDLQGRRGNGQDTHIAIALGFLLRISVKASLKETYHRP